LQTLIRSTGAYFVRRNSGDPLYRRVLERYIHMATAAGVPQAVYPEGGLSRDGRLRPPKLGILDYMLRSFDPVHGDRDLVFIPVGINYDRVLEDRTLLLDKEADGPRRGRLYAARTALRFLGRNLSLMLRSRWHRFGYACVNFGTPLSMRGYLRARGLDLRRMTREERTTHLERLGAELMQEIGGVIPALPVPLVATVLVAAAGEPLSELELKSRTFRLMSELESAGAHVYIPRRDQDYALVAGLRMLTLRHLVEEKEGLYAAVPAEMPLLRYYAGSIAHLLSPPVPLRG
jgi:glycerol-3-phosphate O-acyltransferase